MKRLTLAIAMLSATPAAATTITFDEFAPMNGDYLSVLPSDQYGYVGVTFTSVDDGSTFGGNSRGNPGFWGLEGTNGAAFQGFNGDSYSQTLTFASKISSFSLDVAKADGSRDVTVELQGFLGQSLQSSTSVALGDVNAWSGLAINGTFDRIVYRALGPIDISGFDFPAYGVDNLNFTTIDASAVPEPATWLSMILGLGLIGAAMRARRKPSRERNFLTGSSAVA